MYDTVSVFDAIEQDGVQHRTASRKALALAHNRVESNLGKFLRAAQNEDEFFERLALVQDDFVGYVSKSADEVGCETPENIAAALRDHYRNASHKPVRRWVPRVAGINAGPDYSGDRMGLMPESPSPGERRTHPPGPHGPESGICPECGQLTEPGSPTCAHCGYNIGQANPYGSSTPGVIGSAGKQSAPLPGNEQPYGVGLKGDQLDFNHPNYNPDTYHICQHCGADYIDPDGHTPCPHCGQNYQNPTALYSSSPQDTTKQDDGSSQEVTCPECGGSGKTNGDARCPKCKGKGRVPNFGGSVLDAISKVAENHNNTDLGGPEPKMDKRKWTPQNPGEPKQDGDVVRKDILTPIPARNDNELKEIGESHTERQDLPTQDNDEPFAPTKVGPAPHTKTFGDGKAADPVTREPLN